MHSDPIADMLTRIRNAQAVKKQTATVVFSKINNAILDLLKKQNYIKDFKINKSDKVIHITLKYKTNGQPAIKYLKRISKPGRRIYAKKNKLPHVLNNYGTAIISTNKGLLTDKKAREQGLGGEIICEIS